MNRRKFLGRALLGAGFFCVGRKLVVEEEKKTSLDVFVDMAKERDPQPLDMPSCSYYVAGPKGMECIIEHGELTPAGEEYHRRLLAESVEQVRLRAYTQFVQRPFPGASDGA